MRRRAFLQASTVLGVAFVSGCALPVIPQRPTARYEDALGWIRHSEGRYELLLPRVEMGQNIGTALKQIACEELGIEWHQLTLCLPHTGEMARVRATVGSESVKDFALPLAQACATLRDALAAGHMQGERMAEPRPAGELRAFRRDARHVGCCAPLEQGHAIVTGEPLYAADVRLPGMMFGRVLRAPVSAELVSTPGWVNEAAARQVPGFVALVRDARLRQGLSDGLGIVARTPGTLDLIEAALDVRWSTEGSFDQADIDRAMDVDRHLAGDGCRYRVHDDAIDAPGPWDVDLRIDIPLAAHAPIQPRAAVAAFDADGGLDLWVGSQDVYYQRDVVRKRLGLDEDRVRVHGTRVGGAFGGKTICTVELEAAVLAEAVRHPVKLQWTRAQEFRQGFHRPPSSHRIRVRLREGRLDQWWHAFASSHILFTNAGLPVWMQRLTDFVTDAGVARGAQLPYRCPTRRAEFALSRLPVFTGPWRGLGAGPNGLAMESAIDECARHAGLDPVAFRLQHIGDARLAGVLKAAVAQAGSWRARPAGTRQGRGVACGTYKQVSHAAVVAEVEVDEQGRTTVTRLVCAHDCGTVINPDQVRAQCEGNLVWGLGMALSDRLHAAGARIAAGSFAEAPIPSLHQIPRLEVVLVDEGGAPGGAGETAIVATAAAIANAVREATGVRIQRFPIDPLVLALPSRT
ncbi:xanthine dehydrogenase family protein molybdopterin-binding subunit [Hydrogenophaga laconesensis]|uniref:Isoquinoline 1-oxidoreductase beta subunit n=1 Tax=Hydrogenophaga laconesensis TaxID=1805971 RepID=A0ABU1VEI5_9BURK|nr:molybdopterin cofactor-binding domain-containing protein [Hydrogenophaga laconesensis]MDR7095881.1 isoquinoline 1-oxidoreductase beta subunit [Hydrogenophaga laconesensis]